MKKTYKIIILSFLLLLNACDSTTQDLNQGKVKPDVGSGYGSAPQEAPSFISE